jgi:hypothetical protein
MNSKIIDKIRILYGQPRPQSKKAITSHLQEEGVEISYKEVCDIISEYKMRQYHVPTQEVEEVINSQMEVIIKNKLKNAENKQFIDMKMMDYFTDKLIKEMKKMKPPEIFVPEIKVVEGEPIGVLNLADFHTGMQVNSEWNKFNNAIAKERIKQLIEETIVICRSVGIKKLYVIDHGDKIHGIIHITNRVEAEMDVVSQVTEHVNLKSMLYTGLSIELLVIASEKLTGNHGRVIPTKSAAIHKENLEGFVHPMLSYKLQNNKNIIMRDDNIGLEDSEYIMTKIFDEVLLSAHGDKDSTSAERMNRAINMVRKHGYPTFFILGHLHTERLPKPNQMIRTLYLNSFCGQDNFAKSLRFQSRPGQSMLVFYPDGKWDYRPIEFR